jgi:hypothetical protein
VLFNAPNPEPLRTPDLPADDGAPVTPIGPERLRALREAILNGTYPLDAAVTSGLTTLFQSGGPGAPSLDASPRAARA